MHTMTATERVVQVAEWPRGGGGFLRSTVLFSPSDKELLVLAPISSLFVSILPYLPMWPAIGNVWPPFRSVFED